MLYFHVNQRLEVTAITDMMPAVLRDGTDPTQWARHPSNPGRGWVNRNDFDNMMFAQAVADAATVFSGRKHIATDSGEWVSPRYDVIEAPAVGDEVSKAFNGDYYPQGTIVKISDSMRVIETSTGLKFYRRKQSGAWINRGTWSLVPGHHTEWNPHF